MLGKKIGRAGDRTSDLLFSSLQRYRLSYGTWQVMMVVVVTDFEVTFIGGLFKIVWQDNDFVSMPQKKKGYGPLKNFISHVYCGREFGAVLPVSLQESLSSLALVFKCLQLKSFENTVGKEKIARNE